MTLLGANFVVAVCSQQLGTMPHRFSETLGQHLKYNGFIRLFFSISISDLKFHYFSSNLCASFVGKPKPEIYTSHTLPRKGHVQSLGHRNEVNSASLQWQQWREGWRVGFMLEEMSAAMRGAVPVAVNSKARSDNHASTF
jgi:hypothetical protein